MGDLYTEVIHKRYVIYWEALGSKLGLTNDQIVIISDNNKNNPKKAQDCCTAMLREWLRIDPLPSWGKLNDAINKIETIMQKNKDYSKIGKDIYIYIYIYIYVYVCMYVCICN